MKCKQNVDTFGEFTTREQCESNCRSVLVRRAGESIDTEKGQISCLANRPLGHCQALAECAGVHPMK